VYNYFYSHFNFDELMLHERLYYKENNSKACNRMPRYNIGIVYFEGRIMFSIMYFSNDFMMVLPVEACSTMVI
jgi:hypothetical protein